MHRSCIDYRPKQSNDLMVFDVRGQWECWTFSLEKALLWSMDCSLARRNSLKVKSLMTDLFLIIM